MCVSWCIGDNFWAEEKVRIDSGCVCARRTVSAYVSVCACVLMHEQKKEQEREKKE